MENTQKKELSSLHTPKGGTEKDTFVDPDKELSEEDNKIEVETDPVDQTSKIASDNHTSDLNNNQIAQKDLDHSEDSNSSEEQIENILEIQATKENTTNEGTGEEELTSSDPDPEIDETHVIGEDSPSAPEEESAITNTDENAPKAEIELEKNEDDGKEEEEDINISTTGEGSKESDKSDMEATDPTLVPTESKIEPDTQVEAEKGDEQVEKSESKDKDPEKVVAINEGDENSETKDSPEKEARIQDDHDFSAYTAEQIVELVKKLAHYEDMIRAEKILRKVKGRMSELQKEERANALKKFVEGGGEESDFSYKASELFIRFDANSKLIHDRKHQYLKDLERRKEENLAKAEVLLERLREFLDGSESTTSFKVFKEIQSEWKGMGPLPGTHYRSLWANYNALVNRFYDTRSIYFELKELDRKKNLEYKTQLCEKAEALEHVKDLKEAIIQLNELHDEFKHTGPVPLADQEPLWQRFKGASDKVYERRKKHNAVVKKELKQNLKAKLEIAELVHTFAEFESDRIKDWNTKTREILDLQKKWEAAGGLPREKAREVNKKFWSSFKTYFNRKNDFFRKLEGQRTENLKLKEELVTQASELKDSTDWEATAQTFKNLQSKWKEIGPVPEKVRNEVYARFKASCDHFFNQKREQSRAGGKEYEANLEKKKTIIKEIKKLGKEEKDVEKLKDLQEQFYEVGYVPRSEVSSIKTEFNDSLNEFLDNVEDIDESEKDAILLENKVEKLKHSPNADKKLYQKEQSLKKQINKIENDVSIWKNNIEFFANTKNAEKLKEEFRKKIDDASQELEHLKQELRVYAKA